MEYKLFDDYITLQSLLKELGIIQSGGAVKSFLANTTVLFNDTVEDRRGKKLRLGDVITIPSQSLTITIVKPSDAEKTEHLSNLAEKKRVAAIVKQMNSQNKRKKEESSSHQKAIRFPGT